MPIGAAAIPLISAIGGAGLSALGGRGNQGGGAASSNSLSKTYSDNTSAFNTTGATSGGGNYWNTTTPTEADYFSNFRQSLIPSFQNALYNASKPIFGPAQIAAYTQNLNKSADQSSARLKSQLARSGALNSGRYGVGLGAIERERLGKLADFQASLPFQQAQYQNNLINQLLGMGMNFAGRAPLGQTATGDKFDYTNTTSGGQQVGSGQQQTQQQGQQTTSQQGPSFLNNLFGNFGGVLTNFGLGNLGGGGGYVPGPVGLPAGYNPYGGLGASLPMPTWPA